MVSIPGWAYLIIGAGMSWYARFVGNRLVQSAGGSTQILLMKLFFWIGIVFLFVGIGKIGMKHFVRKADPGESAMSSTQGVYKGTKRPNVVGCPFCRGQTYGHARFCHRCGGRLK